jgi:hypothetical protein
LGEIIGGSPEFEEGSPVLFFGGHQSLRSNWGGGGWS